MKQLTYCHNSFSIKSIIQTLNFDMFFFIFKLKKTKPEDFVRE